MLKSILCGALGASLLVGTATAQQRSETVPVSNSAPELTGFVADVYGSNFNGFSVVGYKARVDNFDFGNGTIASVDSDDDETITYSNRGFNFYVYPQFVWGAWCVGLGTVVFEADY